MKTRDFKSLWETTILAQEEDTNSRRVRLSKSVAERRILQTTSLITCYDDKQYENEFLPLGETLVFRFTGQFSKTT